MLSAGDPLDSRSPRPAWSRTGCRIMVQFCGPPGTKQIPASLTSKLKLLYQPTLCSVMVSR